ATFTGNASFSGATFTGNASFSGATFTGNANFSEAIFERLPIFRKTGGFGLPNPAKFSCKADPEDYNFEVSPESPCIIETEEKEYNGAKFIIPKDAELFDPDKPSEQDNNDDN
uniref:pentapeptide repeat-containing protein n=1 Tax=Rothia aeria TaxID=172042 RepID=UPI0028D044F1